MKDAPKTKGFHVLFHMGEPYDDTNPCGKRIHILRDELEENGCRTTILTPDYKDKNCSDVICCRTVRMKKKTSVYRFLYGFAFAATSFWKALTVGKVHVVVTTSPPPLISMSGWLIAKIKGAKLVYDVRDIWPDVAWEMGSFDPGSMYSRVFSFIRNFMLRHADLVTTVSHGKVKKLQGYAPGSDIIMIMNGLDENFLNNRENTELIAQYGLGQRFTCVYIGNLGLAQGLMQLLHLAKRARDEGIEAQFLLLGTGAEEGRLKQYAQEEHLEHVLFPGRLPNDDMYTILKYADMSFVSLSNGRLKDSVPTKMFEALGAGCPVLLAAEGESADILEESGLGVAVSPNDEEALWEGFSKMYTDRQEILKNREQACRLMLTKYSRQKAALQFAEELEKRFPRAEKQNAGFFRMHEGGEP